MEGVITKTVLDGHNVFVTGKGGTGKTFLLNSIIASQPKDKVFYVTKKSHLHEQVLQRVRSRKDARIAKAQLLFIDKVSMLSAKTIDILNFWRDAGCPRPEYFRQWRVRVPIESLASCFPASV